MSWLYETLRELFQLLTGIDREGTPRAWATLIALITLALLIIWLVQN